MEGGREGGRKKGRKKGGANDVCTDKNYMSQANCIQLPLTKVMSLT